MSIGQRSYRLDAPGKVSGATLYPGDISPANLLHGQVLFSNQPHARLKSIDCSRAEALSGVVAIFTAPDVPVNEYGLMMSDQPVLVGPGGSKPYGDVSRWEGDQVAVVVAETPEIAAQALELIQLDWELLPVVTDVLEALEGEVQLHPDHGSNVVIRDKFRKGEMSAGWAAADVIVEGTYRVPRQEHAFLQPEAGLAYIDAEGRVTVEIGGQWTHEDQEQIAHALDLPEDQVRVIYPAIGGAFGGREDMSLQIVLALAVWRLQQRGINRPVRIIWSREESIVGHHKRHAGLIKARWGATSAGIITAIESTTYLDAGAYNYTSNKVLGNAHLCVVGPYAVPNAHVDSYAIYTNNVPGGAFRGFGAPQGAFAAEGQMNRLAVALNLDPVELRRRNILREGVDTVTQHPLPAGVSLPVVIDQCLAVSEWQHDLWGQGGPHSAADSLPTSFRTLPAAGDVVRRGRGFACAMKNIGFSFGAPEGCDAIVELHGQADIDQVVLYHAGAEVGQGSHTAFQQMAAEAVGVSLDMVEVRASDTASSGNSGSVSASRMTFMAGNAIRGAAREALEAWQNEERPAISHYRYVAPKTTPYDPDTGVCDPNISYGYVAQVADVVVDTETGHIYVDRLVSTNDVGKAINPTLIEGQIEGAVVQAHGYAVTENLQLADGRILNPRLSTYLIPGIQDIPARVDSVILEEPDPRGPWGARGMAEMPFIPYAPAVAAALYDATGIWFDEIPLTPSRVRQTLRAGGFYSD